MTVLCCGDVSVGLVPELGGSLSFVRLGDIDIFRPLSDADRQARNILGVASFPMVPYANRIGGNAFSFAGSDYRVRPNLPGEPFNVHGSGWTSAWTVSQAGEAAAVLRLAHRDPDDPFAYDATQEVTVSESGFRIDTRIVNRSDTAMPFGFGHHPWFPRDPDTILSFAAGTVWLLTLDHVPVERVALSDAMAQTGGRPLPAEYRDHCYGGWDGRFSIRYPARGLTLDVAADPIFRHLMFYADPAQPCFCVEPQTNATGAFNKLETDIPDLGVIVLPPGAAADGNISFKVSRVPAAS